MLRIANDLYDKDVASYERLVQLLEFCEAYALRSSAGASSSSSVAPSAVSIPRSFASSSDSAATPDALMPPASVLAPNDPTSSLSLSTPPNTPPATEPTTTTTTATKKRKQHYGVPEVEEAASSERAKKQLKKLEIAMVLTSVNGRI